MIPFFDIINLLLSLTAAFNFILGIIIYLKGSKNKINKVYSWNIVFIVSWILAMFMYRVAPASTGIFWCKILYIAPTFIASSFLYFTYIFPSPEKIKWWKLFLIFSINIFLVSLIASPKLIIREVNIRPGLEKEIIFGSAYILYGIYILYYFSFGFFRLFKKYLKSTRIEQTQIIYLLSGYALAANLAFVTNLIMPWLGLFFLNWLGQIFTIFMIGATAYAILKHHLFNIKVIATEMFASFISVVLLVDALIAKSQGEFILKFSIFVGGSFLGALLIRGVLKEIKSAEKIKELADDLSKANKKLKSANRELKRLDDAKSEFLSIASHQLRTPLTAIKGLSSMLMDGDFGKIDGETKDAVNNIFLSSERMNKLINNLLNISRIEGGRLKYNFEKKDLNEIVKGVVDELSPMAQQRGLTLNFKRVANLPEVSVDLEKIRQVILNYIDNSIKYTQAGIIDIKLEKIKWSKLKTALTKSCQFELNKKIFANHNGKDMDFIIFTVADKGRGISKDDQRRLFQKFTRGTGMSTVHTEGTGLGLYVCRKMIEAHSGFFWVESAGEGKGSRFCFAAGVGN